MEQQHPASKRYPPELKERAVRMVLDLKRVDPGDHGVTARSPASSASASSPCAPG
jgi:transposase-like protein